MRLCDTHSYYRWETRRKKSRRSEVEFDDGDLRDDDSKFMTIMWAMAWLATTVGFVPFMKTLLGGLDCTQRDNDVWTWDRDSTSEFNTLTADEKLLKSTLYAGDHQCFEGVQLALYVSCPCSVCPVHCMHVFGSPPPPPPPHTPH